MSIEVEIVKQEPTPYDEAVFTTLDVDDTAYTYYKPKVDFQFLITGILAFADRDVNDQSDTVISIYESLGEGSGVPTKILLQFGMGKLTNLSLVPLNLLISSGVYVNAQTSDDDIHMTIMGHYIPKV